MWAEFAPPFFSTTFKVGGNKEPLLAHISWELIGFTHFLPDILYKKGIYSIINQKSCISFSFVYSLKAENIKTNYRDFNWKDTAGHSWVNKVIFWWNIFFIYWTMKLTMKVLQCLRNSFGLNYFWLVAVLLTSLSMTSSPGRQNSSKLSEVIFSGVLLIG